MYAITGVTGHVGGAAARDLLAKGEPVRAVVRDAARSADWIGAGAEVSVADFGDRAALAEAFRGCRGAFVLLPTDPVAADADVYHRRLADSIAGAVLDSGVPHVVMLSSIGAELAEGTGPIRWLHHMENRLRETGVLLTAIRSSHFQEKVETVLGAALGAGVYPVFGASADVPVPMVATRDIGRVVAESLTAPATAGEIIDLDGHQYSERQVAEELAAVLGRPLTVVTIPQPAWVGTMVEAGVPPQLAEELAGLYDAEQRGILQPGGDRSFTCPTPLGETLRHLVKTTL
ncbi:NmrA family NAD(P)-binding protein [Streptosporangium sp. OZ121]|uniref:NmrA family NAD(P)-binding protein n=1 Tax=Streptosporangium sp. OZ121 TaxID=3444183 RepID=UPI003F7B0226